MLFLKRVKAVVMPSILVKLKGAGGLASEALVAAKRASKSSAAVSFSLETSKSAAEVALNSSPVSSSTYLPCKIALTKGTMLLCFCASSGVMLMLLFSKSKSHSISSYVLLGNAAVVDIIFLCLLCSLFSLVC